MTSSVSPELAPKILLSYSPVRLSDGMMYQPADTSGGSACPRTTAGLEARMTEATASDAKCLTGVSSGAIVLAPLIAHFPG
jgi:hypothetical protein